MDGQKPKRDVKINVDMGGLVEALLADGDDWGTSAGYNSVSDQINYHTVVNAVPNSPLNYRDLTIRHLEQQGYTHK